MLIGVKGYNIMAHRSEGCSIAPPRQWAWAQIGPEPNCARAHGLKWPQWAHWAHMGLGPADRSFLSSSSSSSSVLFFSFPTFGSQGWGLKVVRVSQPLKVVRGLPMWAVAHDFKFLAKATKASLIKLSCWLMAQVFGPAWLHKPLPALTVFSFFFFFFLFFCFFLFISHFWLSGLGA